MRSEKAPSLARVPSGLARAAKLRGLDAGGGRWLIVADVPLAHYGEAALALGLRDLDWVSACALAHEAVIENFLFADALLPMKLFTLFGNDDRALAHVRRSRARIDRLLSRVAGREEWGLRVVLDEVKARSLAAAKRTPAGPATGAAFLLRKKRDQDFAREALAGARAQADRLFVQLKRSAVQAQRRTPTAEQGGRLVLHAAFLVENKDGAKFSAHARAGLSALTERGCDAALSGPWPAYHFVGSAR